MAASEIVQEPMVEEPLERLAERLGDPGVQESPLALVEHLDLIALVVTSLDEFLRRGEEIAGVLAEGVAELKVAGSSGGETVSSLGAIARAGAKLAPRAVPLLERLGASEVLTEDAVANLELVTDALDEARARHGGVRHLGARQRFFERCVIRTSPRARSSFLPLQQRSGGG